MGKNQRHKKTLKSEKSKVKLKAKAVKTKFLPKGANVTDTNFKVKAIVIREQLKAHSSEELLTKRKLNFKDLLTRLNHHNTTVRFEGCEGLVELVQGSPQDVVELNLHALLQGVCKLILDREKKVRNKAIKLISEILGKASVLKISPFFDILISYTTCAMTHIDISIQEDSLLVVDAFLQHTPTLIARAFNKMVSNFLTLISKLRSESNPSRTLTINLGSKITSVRWRIKVLSRLRGILEVVVKEFQDPVQKADGNCVVVVAKKIGGTIPLYKGVKRCPIKFYSRSSSNATTTEDSTVQYIDVLVPLLHETWAEAVPLSVSKNASNGVTMIEPEAASILGCVIGIFYLLSQFSKPNDDKVNKMLLSKENQKFFNHILNQFPYRQQDAPKQQKLKKEARLLESSTDHKCVRENLLVSYVFCLLYRTFPNAHYQKKAGEILSYINMCLVNRNYITSENVPILILTLRIIFFDNSKSWISKDIEINDVLDNLVHFHTYTNLDWDNNIEVFNLLSDVVQLQELNRSPKYQHWLSSLPYLLCQPEVSEKVLNTLSVLSRQNNGLFLQALLKDMPQILANLPLIKVKDPGVYPPHLKIVSMFSYIPLLEQEHLNLLRRFIATCEDSKMACYVGQILQERL